MPDKGNGMVGTTCIALAVAGLALTASLILAYYATRSRVDGLHFDDSTPDTPEPAGE